MNPSEKSEEIWARQYPFGGFSFGLDKPTVHIVQERGRSVHRFTGSAINGEIQKCLYPNFSLDQWTTYVYEEMDKEWISRLGIIEDYPEMRYAGPDVIQKLIDKRSPGEKDFIEGFFHKCSFESDFHEDGTWRGPNWVPVPIPQVWIQWHSDSVVELKKWGSPYASQPQRIDFAMFWNNKRFAILIDGIQHYARKQDTNWIASEEEYANRLLEDRFLRSNDWEVFRVSNWELRDWKKNLQNKNSRVDNVFQELEEFVEFEFWPEWRVQEFEKSRYE
jgi:hypothetical protein